MPGLKNICIVFLALALQMADGPVRAQQCKLDLPGEESRIALEFKDHAFHLQFNPSILELNAAGEKEVRISLGNLIAYPGGPAGEPELPVFTRLIEAGREDVENIAIGHLDSTIIDLDAYFPGRELQLRKPAIRKTASHEPADPEKWEEYPAGGEWLGGPLLRISYQGVMRGVHMSSLEIRPLRYHPEKRLLKIYHSIDGEISLKKLNNGGGELFPPLHKRIVRRGGHAGHKAIRSDGPMTMVILADSIFREGLQELVDWKTRKGFRVIECYPGISFEGKDRARIKTHLSSLYHDPPGDALPPSYLMIVGDVDNIPASSASGELSDLYYATYDGSEDYIPDLFYGRISVQDSLQLKAYVDKVLLYEQYNFPDPAFLDRSVLIAGVDASYARTYGNGQVNYAFENYLGADRGFDTRVFHYPGSDTADRHIIDLVSEGVGFVNYTGHGLVNEWMNPRFHKSDIADLENTGRYPLMIGNGCETNYFLQDECFAEALIRAGEKGALAYIGCTNDSYWEEDFYWAVGLGEVSEFPVYSNNGQGYYDKVFHLHGEEYSQWSPSLGEMVFGGNMAVQESNSGLKRFYWEIYQLAGDPSIVPWFGQAGDQHIELRDKIPRGTRYLHFSCAANSYAGLSSGGRLIDARHAGQEGTVSLFLPDSLDEDLLELMVSATGFKPFYHSISIAGVNEPYADLLDYGLSEETVLPDLSVSPGEQFSLDLDIINRGAVAFRQDSIGLRSVHPGIEVLEPDFLIHDLPAGDTLKIRSAFRLQAADRLVDGDNVQFELLMNGDQQIYLDYTVKAPVLEAGTLLWDDRKGGDGDGVLEAGEWIRGKLHLKNSGHFHSADLMGSFTHADRPVFDSLHFFQSPGLAASEATVFLFNARVAQSGKGTADAGVLQLNSDWTSLETRVELVLGTHSEDFSHAFPVFPFRNDPEKPWTRDSITSASPQASFRSGTISHGQRSSLYLPLKLDQRDTISFRYRVSSEAYYDFLDFELDSTLVESWSGESGWRYYLRVLDPGEHLLAWHYRKDDNTSRGEDAAWIDDLVFPAGAYSEGDLSLVGMDEPFSGPWLGKKVKPAFFIRNTSDVPVKDWSLYWNIGEQGNSISGDRPVQPGETLRLEAQQSADLSSIGSYLLQARLEGDSLAYRGNNFLEEQIIHWAFPDLAIYLDATLQEDGRARAAFRVENLGNVPRSSPVIESRLGDSLLRVDTLKAELLPGEEYAGSLTLMEEISEQEKGLHDFSLSLVQADSVEENNRVSGNFFLTALQEQVQEEGQWRLRPNPAGDLVFLELEGPTGPGMVDVFGPDGRHLLSLEVRRDQQKMRIPLGDYPPGIYAFSLKTNRSVRTKLLVIN